MAGGWPALTEEIGEFGSKPDSIELGLSEAGFFLLPRVQVLTTCGVCLDGLKGGTLQADSLPAEPQGSLRILEWVAYPFSRGSS